MSLLPVGSAGGQAVDARSIATSNSNPEPAQIGRPHPTLELDVIDGSLVNQARLAGRPFVVDFFATWCEPCHRALEDLEAARAATPGTADLTVVLVDLSESPEVVRRWAARAGLPQQAIVTLDPLGVAARRWGAHRLPTTFLVDASGVVRHINRGWGPGYRARLSRWLRDLPPGGPGAQAR
ncbi:MAG: TlpA disulfide reductase family protein [Myxococcales bacterium]